MEAALSGRNITDLETELAVLDEELAAARKKVVDNRAIADAGMSKFCELTGKLEECKKYLSKLPDTRKLLKEAGEGASAASDPQIPKTQPYFSSTQSTYKPNIITSQALKSHPNLHSTKT